MMAESIPTRYQLRVKQRRRVVERDRNRRLLPAHAPTGHVPLLSHSIPSASLERRYHLSIGGSSVRSRSST